MKKIDKEYLPHRVTWRNNSDHVYVKHLAQFSGYDKQAMGRLPLLIPEGADRCMERNHLAPR